MRYTSFPRRHVNHSILDVGDNSWLIGENLLLTRQPTPGPGQPSWSDGEDGFFVLSDAPFPLPEGREYPKDSADLPRVYAAGDQSAVWRAGEAFIKVHDIRHPEATDEHVTLEFIHSKKPLGFDIPDILYHGQWDDRDFLILSRVPGRTLAEAWTSMDEPLRQYYIARVAELCEQMAAWKGEAISGVDGCHLKEFYLRTEDDQCLDPQSLRKNCIGMGMETSSLVFYHCDLGPTNIIVDPETRGIGIIDWEISGYVPREWIRTKFHLSGGMDFPTGDEDSRSDWRRLVARKLAEKGFPEVIDGWLAYRSSN